MFTLGRYQFQSPVFLAPMEDVTDGPFRRICRQFGADAVFTEFTSSEALIRDVDKAFQKIKISEAERPVGIQLFGGRSEAMAEAARRAESEQPDFLDINCGCWVKNHALRGEGAGLLRDLPRLEAIVRETVRATRLPVTVKTRLGWDEKSIIIEEAAQRIEQAGARMLTVHCRTRMQGYQGNADWSWIPRIKRRVSLPVIVNGDIRTVEDVLTLERLGCDGMMIGRAAIGFPWIFQQVKGFREQGRLPSPPSFEERCEVMLRHLRECVKEKGCRMGMTRFRKYYSGYLSGLPGITFLRQPLMTAETPEHAEQLCQEYANSRLSAAATV